jgi:hypothetical protein
MHPWSRVVSDPRKPASRACSGASALFLSTNPVAHYVHSLALEAPKPSRAKFANLHRLNGFQPLLLLEYKLQPPLCLPWQARPEWHLTTLFANTPVAPVAAPKKMKKWSLLPLLTVVFVASYGLMTLLIVEQGETIQAQRNLIKILLVDSKQLWTMKGHALADKLAQAQPQAQKPSAPSPSTHGQAPSVRTPLTQTPLTQAPSTQVPPHRSQSRAGKSAKPDIQVPPVPASDLGDQRRVVITL